jgi:hypothetical protein
MDESRTKCETIVFSLQIVLYLIDDIGLCRLVISCMDIDPWWLVHDHQILILVEDEELECARSSPSRGGAEGGGVSGYPEQSLCLVLGRDIPLVKGETRIISSHIPHLFICKPEAHLISEFELVGLILFLLIYFDLASSEHLENTSEWCIWEVFANESVDTLIGISRMCDSYGEHLLEYRKISRCIGRDLRDTNLTRPEISSNECTGIKDHILGGY